MKKKSEDKQEKEYFYISDDVYDYDFSDFVKLNSSPKGILLAFGKYCPEKRKFGIFNEILLPFEVADALSEIIKNHLRQLQEKGLIEKTNIDEKVMGK